MAEPQRDDGAANAPVKKLHCCGVSQAVRAHLLAFQRLALVKCECRVFAHDTLVRVATQSRASVTHEQGLVVRRRPLIEPVPEYLDRIRSERGRARFAPRAPASDVGALVEVHITAVKTG